MVGDTAVKVVLRIRSLDICGVNLRLSCLVFMIRFFGLSEVHQMSIVSFFRVTVFCLRGFFVK